MPILENLPYDKSSALSIFEYSKGLLDKTLRDFIHEEYKQKNGKGKLGQMVENIYFFLETNNNPEADFSTAGLELKCTPLKKGSKDQLLIKERLSCNMINYCDVVKEEFQYSHFYLKCQLMLLLFYLYEKNRDNLDLKFIFSVLWKLPEKDLLVIQNDYNIIIEKIKLGQAHLLSEGDTMYLGACRKGQKGDSLMKQPYNEIDAPRRAFSLKMTYMRIILQHVIKSGKKAVSNFKIPNKQLVTTKDLYKNNFEDILLNRFNPYFGKNYNTIASDFKINLLNNPKNKFAIIANAIISNKKVSNVNRCEEFLKAGLTMKTIRVQYNGNIKEAMSFENIDYIEISECENWYESRLYELFTSRFMFVVFKEQSANSGNYVLEDAFFWTMPQKDLKVAEEYWNHIKKHVIENKISEEYWWKAKDKKKFHVRPKGKNSNDLAVTANGSFAKKFCYWFNNDYVKQIVNRNVAK